MRVLVPGAGGQVGTELVEELRRRAAMVRRGGGLEVVAADRARLDVTDRDAVLGVLTTHEPEVVIHSPAVTAVADCERDPGRADAVNALGTRHLAEGARLVGAHLLYVSTDYVFDGTSARPYTEWDLPNPRSVYGASKLGGERELGPEATIVRTSWVCGRHGANIVKTALRLLSTSDGPLRFVADQQGSPTIAGDLAGVLCDLALERRPGLFHVTNSGATSWYGFVRAVAAFAGYDASRVEPITTAELDPPRPAPRPAYSVLENAALALSGLAAPGPWEEATEALVASSRRAAAERRRPGRDVETSRGRRQPQRGEALLGCVESLRAAGVEEVVVVDNASNDGSLARLAASDAAVGLLPTGANLGYGRAANRGAARTGAPYLLICNPDLVVQPDAVKMLLAELEEHPDVAAVGPRILDGAGGVYPSGRAIPSLLTGAGHALVGPFLPDNPWSRRYRQVEADPAEAREVDWVSGAFLLLRRIAFESVSGFDERYFMYVEDLDLCWRLGRAGWKVRYVPQAVIVHEQGRSAARYPLRMLAAHHRSTWRSPDAQRRTDRLERCCPVIGLGLGIRSVWRLVAAPVLAGAKGPRRIGACRQRHGWVSSRRHDKGKLQPIGRARRSERWWIGPTGERRPVALVHRDGR